MYVISMTAIRLFGGGREYDADYRRRCPGFPRKGVRMSADVLKQDEIDALLNGISNGEVSTQAPDSESGSEPRPYDLATQQRIVRGRMPTLEMINGRFARLLRNGLFSLLRRSPEIGVKPVNILKFSEYTQTLAVPASMNMVKLNPLRGTALFVLDATLVFAIVDQFFGGQGLHAKIEGRDFTRTENRIVRLLLDQAFADMREAWSGIAALEPEYLSSEINPQFATIVSPSEIVVVTSFKIDFEGAGGQFHITLPFSMIEPIRDVLDSGMQSDRAERDENWTRRLRQELNDVQIELTPVLGTANLSLERVLHLKPGDVIPCSFDGNISLFAEGVPIVRGHYGAAHGQHAVKVSECLTLSGNSPAVPLRARAGLAPESTHG